MFGKKAELIRSQKALIAALKSDLATSDINVAKLRQTQIIISVPTELGVRPLYQVELEYAILLTNMMNGAEPGYKVEGMTVEVKSEYRPTMEAENGDYPG